MSNVNGGDGVRDRPQGEVSTTGSVASMEGRTVLITGATNGIGRAGAIALARMGAAVIVVGRNEAKGRGVISDIIATVNPRAEPRLMTADLSSGAEVHRLAEEVRRTVPRLDVLINNAGASFTTRRLTTDGIEMTFALNHVAPFILTNRLLDLLRGSTPARVVTTSSDAHRGASIDWDDLTCARGFRGFQVYGRSKLANVLFTKELARRLEGSGVTANCFHPGVVRTGFGHNDGGMLRAMVTVASPFLISPERGARTMVYLASSADVAGVTGGYFAKSRIKEPSAAARNMDDARRLWRVTEEMTTAWV